MPILIPFFTLLLLGTACKEAPAKPVFRPDTARLAETDTLSKPVTDSTQVPKPYQSIVHYKTEKLKAAPGTKSVVFNSRGNHLYAMNLEGMSVYEFERKSRKLVREFRFRPTKGTGWDYASSRPISSFQEKPVEACFSHDDQLLWISLHNADGIVALRLDSLSANPDKSYKGAKLKTVYVTRPGSAGKDSLYIPLIHTGKTPKVITRTADSRHLLVSNWHSYSVSVLKLDAGKAPFGKVIATLPLGDIPRGMAIDEKNAKSFIAIMGGSTIVRVDNNTWKTDSVIQVRNSPRHIVMDSSGHLFVSYNSIGYVACLDARSGQQLFSIKTPAQPRTIALSKNHRFLFVTCYTSDLVDVYKIHPDKFEKVASLPCEGHPVGVDIFEDDDTLEAWVCSYKKGEIQIYSFRKK